MSNSRRRFVGALSLLPLTFSKSSLVFGQTAIPKCETETLQKGAWRSKITAKDISITLVNSQNHFMPVKALSLYEEYKDTESPNKPSYLDVYEDNQFASSAFGSTKAPLNPEITIAVENGRPKLGFVVNDILQNIDTSGHSIRYVSKESGERGLYIRDGKPLAQSPHTSLSLITSGASPNINLALDPVLQSSMSVSLNFDSLLLSKKLLIGYTFDNDLMYYLNIPSKGLYELVKESIALHTTLADKLAQGVCEYDDCFVTSATCGYLGLTDDCWELTQLRAFRDNYLLTLPKGNSLVDRYYDNAPKLLQVINRHKSKSNILLGLYFKDILPSAVLARLKLNRIALWRYMAMMKRLEKQYLSL
jgi:hypothetical protein